MFSDLFHVVQSLEHDTREEKGERVHSYTCRRCALALRLNDFKTKLGHLLKNIDFEIGEPIEKP
jgi:hypothetical protein